MQTVLRISENILSAIDAIHQKGVIHRDIKPKNIMIKERTEVAILIDFGLAKDMVNDAMETPSGIQVGTPTYMSPEICKGTKKPKLTTDIYSFGVVLYEMITGEPPFQSESNDSVALMYAHIQKPTPNIREKFSGLPAGIENVIYKSMAKNPDDRYKSAKEFLDALKEIESLPEKELEPGAVSIIRDPVEKPITFYRKRPPYRKYLIYLVGIIAAAVAAIIIISPQKEPTKEQLSQFMENGEYEKSSDYLEKAKDIKNNNEVHQQAERLAKKQKEKMSHDFEELKKFFLKEEASKSEKKAKCQEFLKRYKKILQNNG
jgi:serine/threonine protein kinase